MKRTIMKSARMAAVMLFLNSVSTKAQEIGEPNYETARALSDQGVTDIATFYVPTASVGLIGKSDQASRSKLQAMLKDGSIKQVYHIASRSMTGELGRKGNFPKIGSINEDGSTNPAPGGGSDMPLGFVVQWERSPVSIKYNVIHGEIGRKSRLGKLMVPTYAHGSAIGGQTIVFDRPVFTMVGLPADSKQNGNTAVVILSPTTVSAIDALSTAEIN